MSWFKVDDKLWGHPKWLATPARARGLWVTAGSYCADHLQDGFVAHHVLSALGGTVKDAAELVKSGLWLPVDGGWMFHGWADFQPSREEVEGKREAARTRMRKARERRQNEASSRDVRANNDGTFADDSREVRLTPTRPDPTRPITDPDGSDEPEQLDPPRFDVLQLCDHLADRIEANGSKRPTVSKAWRDAARLMLDRDGRTSAEVVKVIDWCQADAFWRGNILSMPKLREKFDQLRLQASRARSTADNRVTQVQALKTGGLL